MVAELKVMAALGPGPNPKSLERASEIRFLIQNQEWSSPYLAEKVDQVYRNVEILLSTRRWRELDVDGLRAEIKSGCARILTALGEGARAV